MFHTVKVLLIALLVFLPFYAAEAQEKGASSEERSVSELIEEVEYRIDTNKRFLKASKAIVGGGAPQEALRSLKMATAVTAEAVSHYEAGLYGKAIEDLDESTQMVIHAIILTKGEADPTREFIIHHEYARTRRIEREKKVALINRRVVETRTFVKTAERMLEEGGAREARELLEDGKSNLTLAVANLEQGLYDEALSTINDAYAQVTGSIKEMSGKGGKVIAFPKPSDGSQEEIFSRELKYNETYLFFASTLVKEGKGDAATALRQGRAMRLKAITLMKRGKKAQAIEILKSSTELITEAINRASPRSSE